jgi:hypothetical protein
LVIDIGQGQRCSNCYNSAVYRVLSTIDRVEWH